MKKRGKFIKDKRVYIVPPVFSVGAVASILSKLASQDDMGSIKIRMGKINVVHNKNKLKIDLYCCRFIHSRHKKIYKFRLIEFFSERFFRPLFAEFNPSFISFNSLKLTVLPSSS